MPNASPEIKNYSSFLHSENTRFRANRGQWNDDIKFQAAADNIVVQLMNGKVSFTNIRNIHREGTSSPFPSQEEIKTEMLVWNMHFLNCNLESQFQAVGRKDSKVNYFIGNDPNRHCTNVPEYDTIIYKNLYNGIDLAYYGNGKKIKYDFIVRPFSSLADIRMSYEGIKNLFVNSQNELEIITEWGSLKELKPYSYQLINGEKKVVAVEYVLLNDTTVGFIAENYDPAFELIIDPVTLNWSTFCGGSGSTNGMVYDIEVDSAGNVYVAGDYKSNFPTTPGVYDQTFNNGFNDVIVFKINSSGTNLLYATYIGGSSLEYGFAIELGNDNSIYVAGWTISSDFPTTSGCLDNIFTGPTDGFILKLNNNASALIYSTLIGNAGTDKVRDIAVDKDGQVVAIGSSNSNTFPVTSNAFDQFYADSLDAVIFKLNATGSGLIYSSFLGGTGADDGSGIKLNSAGEAFVTLESTSPDIPVTVNAFDQTYNGVSDIVVAKINADGSAIIYCTYLGGSGQDCSLQYDNNPPRININKDEEAYISFWTMSSDFPVTTNAYDITYNGGMDAFVSKINAAGSALVFSTFIGGTNNDYAVGTVINEATDNLWVLGLTNSSNFPITPDALFPNYNNQSDFFICNLNSDGTQIFYSTYFGGNYIEDVASIKLIGESCEQKIVVSGHSSSSDFFTTPGVYQPGKLTSGSFDFQPVIATFSVPELSVSISYNQEAIFCDGDSFELDAGNPGAVYLWSTGDTTQKIIVDTSGVYFVEVSNASCAGTASDTITIYYSASPQLNLGNDTFICDGDNIILYPGNAETYLWWNGSTDTLMSISFSGVYWVQVGNSQCLATDTIIITVYPTPPADLGNDTALCTGQSLTLISGPADSYLWSNGETDSSITIATSGTYWLEANNYNGLCSSSDTINIIVEPMPVVNLGNDTTLCSGQSLTLISNPSDSYLWSNGETGSSITIVTSGVYWLEASNYNGLCSISDTVNVIMEPMPVVNLGNDTAFCSGQSLTLVSSPADSYLWSNGETSSSTTIVSPGTYWLEASNYNGLCSSSDTINIILETIPVVNLGNDTTLCSGQSLTLISSPADSYFWSNGETGSSITIVASGAYWLEASNYNGLCFSSDTINILVESRPVVNLGNDTAFCSGQSLTLISSSSDTYLWSNGETSSSTTIVSPGTYWLEASNYNGLCSSSDTINIIVRSIPLLDLGNDTVICPGQPINLIVTSATSYLWSNGSTDSLIIISIPGIYWVKISNGACYNSDTITIRESPLCTKIPNVFTPDNDGLNDEFIITIYNINSSYLKIFNRWGLLIYEDFSESNIIKWNGINQKTNRVAEDGTYYFILDYETANDTNVLTGYIMLFR